MEVISKRFKHTNFRAHSSSVIFHHTRTICDHGTIPVPQPSLSPIHNALNFSLYYYLFPRSGLPNPQCNTTQGKRCLWTRNPSPSPTQMLWMTGTLVDTSEKHHGNAYTICVTICLENQQVTACADFHIPHTQSFEPEHFYWRFQGYIVGRGSTLSCRMIVQVSVMQEVVCESWAICAWVCATESGLGLSCGMMSCGIRSGTRCCEVAQISALGQ
jgi:hypothetical protein